MSNRAERQARAQARADQADAKATAAGEAVDNHIVRQIPLGQPILVGHYSEKRHRRDIASFERTLKKAVESNQYAREAADRARNSGHAIQVGDDDAVIGLTERIKALQDRHDQYLRHNKETKKGNHTVDIDECPGCSYMNTPRIGDYPTDPVHSFQLTNSRNKIKNAKKQLAKAEKVAERKAQAEQAGTDSQQLAAGDGWEITDDIMDDKIRVSFDTKPDRDTIDYLKSHGWRWSRHNHAWQRSNAGNAALYVRGISAHLAK